MGLFGQMALVALVVGTSATVSATERVTIALVLAGFLGWGFVPVLQLCTGLVLVGRTRPRLALLERYFFTHWAWSLWILAAHIALLMVPLTRLYAFALLLTTGVPLIVTVRLLLAFCREHLGLPAGAARRAVALHQVITYALVLGYISFAVALWPRIVGLFA